LSPEVVGKDAFRKAAEAGDMAALAAALDPDVTFRCPALKESVAGRDRVAAILAVAFGKVYQDFLYTDVLESASKTVLLFSARVGEHDLEGAQVLRFGADGRVRELVVLVRPAPAAAALGEAILAHLSEPRREN
jgi:SnoaL-like domain